MKKIIVILTLTLVSQVVIRAQSKDNKISEIKIKTTAQCSQCKERIETALAFEKGINSSDLDLETKILTVVYKTGKTTDVKIRTAVAKLGYDADDVKKDEKAYKNLPGCCKLPDDPEHVKH